MYAFEHIRTNPYYLYYCIKTITLICVASNYIVDYILKRKCYFPHMKCTTPDEDDDNACNAAGDGGGHEGGGGGGHGCGGYISGGGGHDEW